MDPRIEQRCLSDRIDASVTAAANAATDVNRTAPSCLKLDRYLAPDCFVGSADGNLTLWVHQTNVANFRALHNDRADLGPDARADASAVDLGPADAAPTSRPTTAAPTSSLRLP